MNDGQLLRQYRQEGQEPAFEELIARHVDLVYTTALRRVGDPHAAEDVSQAVFCLLLHKAGRLFGVAHLAGWLHRAACWKAAEHLRSERRRRFHEQEAATMNDTPAAGPDPWADIAPRLDETLNRLSERDRQLILLRYYRRLSLREIGGALRLSEDAVRMRINRALERLRRQLGTTTPAVTGAFGLGELLSAQAVEPAPARLAARIVATAPGSMPLAPGGMGVALAEWGGQLFSLKTATVVLALLAVVNLGFWVHDRSTRSSPALDDAESQPSAAQPGFGQPATGSLPSRFPAVRSSLGNELQLASLLAALEGVLRSAVDDQNWPPQDLRDRIRALSDHPEAALTLLFDTIYDPGSIPATRERAVWGLWLVGEEAPHLVAQILPVLSGLISAESERELWWHAAEVLKHLRVPDGSVRLVEEALRINPAAGMATLGFWASAVHYRAAEVAEAVRPWLMRDDPLRFCAATILARIPGEDFNGLLPILAKGVQDPALEVHALRGLEAMGPAAASLGPWLGELLLAAEARGHTAQRDRLIAALAAVAPDSRGEWPEVEQVLRGKEQYEAFNHKRQSGTVTMADLITALDHPKTAWMAALDLEDMGSAAAEALPALYAALMDPDQEHDLYLANAIKAIDPGSPKPLFARDNLLSALRALSDTLSELDTQVNSSDREAVGQFVDRVRRMTPEQVADQARKLEAVDPRLRQTWVAEVLKVDPALGSMLTP